MAISHWYEVQTTGKSGETVWWAENPDDAAHKAYICEKLLVAGAIKDKFGTILSALKTDDCETAVQEYFRVIKIKRLD